LVERLNGGADRLLMEALTVVFTRIPASLHAPTYKALVRVWHPDAGGDHKVMQALNLSRPAVTT